MKISIKEITERYNSCLEESKKYMYYVRDKELQQDQYKKIQELLSIIKQVKYQIIESGNEQYSNILFHFQCVLNSFAQLLKMWIELKAGKLYDAWCLLIDAEEYLDVALRIEREHYGLQEYKKRLENIEHCIFPEWPIYNSIAIVTSIGDCSICGIKYSDCDHIEDIIYSGRMCRRVNRKPISIHHTALVDVPKDRRCIIKKISTDNGKMRDYITWKELDEESGAKDDHMNMEACVMSLKDLDYS